MENQIIDKVKEEPQDEDQTFISAMTHSHELIEYFLDNEYKSEGCESNVQLKCLDEVDGKFKHFADISLNYTKPCLDEDLKNYCNKCNKPFSNIFAAQNHYIFTHPDPSFLPVIMPQTNRTSRKRNYNWLDELEQVKIPKKIQEESSHIIIIKDKEEYFKKLSFTKTLVQITENTSSISSKGYTLEDIKAHPQEGIKVVKKSDIQFNRLLMLAERKQMLTKRREPRVDEAPPKRIITKICRLKKIDCETTLQIQSKATRTTALRTLQKSQNTIVKYICRRCNLKMFGLYAFDRHMKMHANASFVCPFCTRTFCTKIGIADHIEACKKDFTSNGVKMMPSSKNKQI